VTFHRAFDLTRDPIKALEDIISLKIERILTSGQESNCLEGLDMLVALTRAANKRIIILPGGGITERNLKKIVMATQCEEIHASCRSDYPSKMEFKNTRVHLGGTLTTNEFVTKATNSNRVQEFLKIVNE